MPGFLSSLFDSGESNEQDAGTANITQDSDPATDEPTSDGSDGEMVPQDIPPQEPGVLGDEPNEAMA